MITGITMGAGNVKVLRETLKSMSTFCNEIIYGDLLLFPEDREILHSYENEFNLKIINFPFDYIFANGFSNVLNVLAASASNDMVVYLNTSETIDENYNVWLTVYENQQCNAFYFIHRTDPHRWYRLYNRHELKWSGVIHEQLEGEYRPYHKPVFMMKDLPKDMEDGFKAKVFDTVKEIVYFNNYISIIDKPETLGATDPGWVHFAKGSYYSFKERLLQKGAGYEAFLNGDHDAFMRYAYSLKEDSQKFESNIGIEYQNNPMFLDKK